MTTAIKQAIERSNHNVSDIARRLDVSPQAVRKWMSGSLPSVDNLKKLASLLGVRPSALIDDDAPASFRCMDSFTSPHGDGWTLVSVLDASGGCAAVGTFEQTGEVIGLVEFSDAYLRAAPGVTGRICAERFCLVEPVGDSMEPTIGRYDHCLIDTAQNVIRSDGIYWLQIDGQFFLKRIARNFDKTLTLISDNPRYPAQVIPQAVAETAVVIGRVIRIVSLRDA